MKKSRKLDHVGLLNIFLIYNIEKLWACLAKSDQAQFWVGVQRGQSYLMGRRCLFSLGHPSSDGVKIKMLYGVDALHRPASHPIFSYWVG